MTLAIARLCPKLRTARFSHLNPYFDIEDGLMMKLKCLLANNCWSKVFFLLSLYFTKLSQFKTKYIVITIFATYYLHIVAPDDVYQPYNSPPFRHAILSTNGSQLERLEFNNCSIVKCQSIDFFIENRF